MCGIAGAFDFELKNRISNINIDEFAKQISHRGPDGKGKYLNENIILLHSRLSIIDLNETGAQPFFNMDKSIVCVVNGEIYNFQELKDELIAKNYTFKGTSDCEIIPYLYEIYGVNLVNHIKGMFAIAIWDLKKDKLVLVRDRFGIKPLYYHVSNDGIIYFGSELKAITFHNNIELNVNLQSIHNYLSLCYIPEPETGFENIFALEPGNILEITSNEVKKSWYWDIDKIKNNYNDSYEVAKKHVNSLLFKSVEKQLISDAPIGAFLSGGIDSSMIVSKIHEIRNDNKFDTFTVKFPDKDFDESPFAEKISNIFNTNHHLFELQEGKADVDLIKKLLSHFDQPFGDSSCIPTYLISKVIKNNVKVSLSGDGGDELFGGYPLFYYFKTIKKIKKIPKVLLNVIQFLLKGLIPITPNIYRKLNKLINLSKKEDYAIISDLKSYITENEKNNIYTINFKEKLKLAKIKPTSKYFEKIWKEDDDITLNISKLLYKTSLPSDMFKKVDMMSMLAGIEVRVPFLDEDLVIYSLALPESYKIKGKNGKYIIKEILAEVLPSDIINKKKTGFAIPLDTMVNPKFENFIKEELLKDNSIMLKIFNKSAIENWVNIFLGKKTNDSEFSREGIYQRIFMLLSLSIWLKKYKLIL